MRCRWTLVGLVCALLLPATAIASPEQDGPTPESYAVVDATTKPSYPPPTTYPPATTYPPNPAPSMKKCSPKPTPKKSCAPKTTISPPPPPKKSCAPKTKPPVPPKKSCAPKTSPPPPPPKKSCAPKTTASTPTSIAPDSQVQNPNNPPPKPTPKCVGFWGACDATSSCTQGSTCVDGVCRPVRVGFEQCGGNDWAAASVCGIDLGWTCVRQAPFFAQCLPVATLQCS